MFSLELQWGLEITQNIYIIEWGLLKVKYCIPVDFLPNPNHNGQLRVVDLCLLTDLKPPALFFMCAALSFTFEYLYEP